MFNEYSPLLQGVVSVDLWSNSKNEELREALHQKDDADFIPSLNKVRAGNIDKNVENILKTHFISKNNPSYPIEALHILLKIDQFITEQYSKCRYSRSKKL